MAAYFIGNIQVTDPDAYPAYAKLSGPTVAQYGGRFLVRGGATESLEGNWETHRLVVLEFDTVEQAKKWWTSPEYAAAKPLRHKAAISNFVLVEGM